MFSKIFLSIVVVLALGACTKKAETSTHAGREFTVDKLFTVDDCTVYRFSDAGYQRYFAKCKNSANTSWSESCGKGCTSTYEVPTQNVN